MSSNILILAPFPDHRYKHDGMISRIKHIDKIFYKIDRTYLYVSFFKNKKKYVFKKENVVIYELNLILHFSLILQILFNSEKLYIHSIYQIRHIWYLIPFYKKSKYLDLHGVVPEELKYFSNNLISSYYMALVEMIVFSTKNLTVICVTNKMILHLKAKYPKFSGEYILYNIYPSHLADINLNENTIDNTNLEYTTFIYAGSCALWQKIELMLDLIKENLNERYKYIILTSNITEFEFYLTKKNIPLNRIELKTVSPEDLFKYYNNAHYGFLLRDDNIVNSVANPTKLIEYLASGITPIVLNPNIGDYFENGYEYITVDKFRSNFIFNNIKSKKNIQVAKKMLNGNLNTDLLNYIFQSK